MVKFMFKVSAEYFVGSNEWGNIVNRVGPALLVFFTNNKKYKVS